MKLVKRLKNMRMINRQEYDSLMNFMFSPLKSLWNHEDEQREKQSEQPLNSFQFGFTMYKITYHRINEQYGFYVVPSKTFLDMVDVLIPETINKTPYKFGTGDAQDVVDALYVTSGYWRSKDNYIDYLKNNGCCYVVCSESERFKDILRLDMFRLIKENKEDQTKKDFIGGLLHALKHFSLQDQNLSTGSKGYKLEYIFDIVSLIGKAFIFKKGSEKNYTSTLKVTKGHIFVSFYKEEVSGIFFLNSCYYKKD